MLVFLLSFVRIGEASVPGPHHDFHDTILADSPPWALPDPPDFVLSVGNPGGISNKLGRLDLFPIGWHHMTETQASQRQQCGFQKYIRGLSFREERNLRSTLGHPAPLRAGSQTAGAWTGVLTFGDLPLKSIPLAWPNGEFASGRVLLSMGIAGDTELTVATVYCPPKGPTYPQAKRISEALLAPITEQLVYGRQGARAIVGDFNCQPGALDQMAHWQSQGWTEVQQLFESTQGIPAKNTCKAATRPDQIWVSPEMALLISNVAVWPLWPDHSVVLAGLKLNPGPSHTQQWRLPGRIPWTSVNTDSWISDSFIGPVFPTSLLPVGGEDMSHVQEPEITVNSQTMTRAFAQWSAKFEQAASQHMCTDTAKADKSYFGRGSLTAPTQRRKGAPIPKHSRPGEVSMTNGLLNRSSIRWFQQLRRLQSYLHAVRSPRAQENYLSRASLWRSVLVARGFKDGFQKWWPNRPVRTQGPPALLPQLPPPLVIAEMIYEDFHQNYRRYEHWQLLKRRESCQSKMVETGKGLFLQTRKAPKAALDCLEDQFAQEILVTDTTRNLITVPCRYPDTAVLRWTLQNEPATVIPVDEGYQVETDFVLASGQTLTCHTMVHKTAELHQRLQDLWKPMWNKHQDVPNSNWQEIVDFACQNTPSGQIDLPPITEQDWHRAVSKFKTTAASGPCGWTRSDILHMTPEHTQAIIDFFGHMEKHACWPQQWCTGLIHVQQKRQDCKTVSDYRPITVTSLFHRIYTGIRAGQILASLANMAAPHQCGYIKGKHSADIWAFVSICIEVAVQHDNPICGWVADLEKCFNTLPRHPVFAFLEHFGVPRWFIKVWNSFLGSFTRYFVVRQQTGDPIHGVTGFPEGCPLSCCAMTAINIVWHVWQQSAIPRSLVMSYVDNMECLFDSVSLLENSMSSFRQFCALMDLRLDEKSLFFWSSCDSGRRELKSKGYKINLSSRDLGGQVIYCKQMRNQVATDRMQSVHEYFLKLRHTNMPGKIKLQNFTQVLWPRALYGCEAVKIGAGHFGTLRSGLMKAMRWDRAGASSWIRVGLLHTAHDPEWIQLRQVVQLFRKLCRTNQVVRDWWQIYSQHRMTQTHGPLGKLQALLCDFGMRLDDQFRLWFSDNGFLNILNVEFEMLERVLCRRFHSYVADKVISRKGFTDLIGFDMEVTTCVDRNLDSSTLEQLNIVRDGAFITNTYKSKFDTRVSAFCDWCQVEDTRTHKFTQCSKYDALRAGKLELFRNWDQYPDCFREHCLVPANPWQELVWEAFIALPNRVETFLHDPGGPRLHIFTDGTCSNPQTPSISLAAWAVVAANIGTISFGPLVGPLQNILRAEITAVISALHWTLSYDGDVYLWVDNDTVVLHLRDLMQGRSCKEFAHQDLWETVKHLMDTTKANLHIHKVTSHLDEMHNESPLEDFCHVWNAQADRQASVANMYRPSFFQKVWNNFVGYRQLWQKRVVDFTSFLVEVARIDCQKEEVHADIEEPSLHFDRHQNSAILSVQISAFIGHEHTFAHKSRLFQQLVCKLAPWLVEQDSKASMMRLVSIPEIYWAFRKLCNQGGLVSCQAGGSSDYRVVTFASDMAFFRNALRFILNESGLNFASDKADLSAILIFTPQLAVQMGWSLDIETPILEDLRRFVGDRPIQNAQGFAKPWNG